MRLLRLKLSGVLADLFLIRPVFLNRPELQGYAISSRAPHFRPNAETARSAAIFPETAHAFRSSFDVACCPSGLPTWYELASVEQGNLADDLLVGGASGSTVYYDDTAL